MPSESTGLVLFLCTGNYYRSRFAECFFNFVALRDGLPWRAESRGLAVEFGFGNLGPMSRAAARSLERLGAKPPEPVRSPLPVSDADLTRAHLIVALKEAEHRPLLDERHPGWASRVEFWHVHDVDDAPPEVALPQIEKQVLALVRRLRERTPPGEPRRQA